MVHRFLFSKFFKILINFYKAFHWYAWYLFANHFTTCNAACMSWHMTVRVHLNAFCCALFFLFKCQPPEGLKFPSWWVEWGRKINTLWRSHKWLLIKLALSHLSEVSNLRPSSTAWGTGHFPMTPGPLFLQHPSHSPRELFVTWPSVFSLSFPPFFYYYFLLMEKRWVDDHVWDGSSLYTFPETRPHSSQCWFYHFWTSDHCLSTFSLAASHASPCYPSEISGRNNDCAVESPQTRHLETITKDRCW